MGVYFSVYVMPRENDFRPSPAEILRLIEALQSARFIPRPGDESLAQIYEAAARESGAEYRLASDWVAEACWEPPAPQKKSFLAKLFGGPTASRPVASRPRIERPFPIPPTGEALAALSGSGVQICWPIEDARKMRLEYPFAEKPEFASELTCDLTLHLSDDFINVLGDLYGFDGTQELATECGCGVDLAYKALNFESETCVRRFCPECGSAFLPQTQTAVRGDGTTGKLIEIRGGICYRFAIKIYCGREFPNHEGATEDALPSSRFMQTCEQALGRKLYAVADYS